MKCSSLRKIEGNHNSIFSSIIAENYVSDLYVTPFSGCNNTLNLVTGSGNRPIEFLNNLNGPVNFRNKEVSELILCGVSHSVIKYVIINGSDTKNNNGFLVYR